MTKEKIIIYQVLPRLFGNNKRDPKSNGSKQENGCGKFSSFSDKALKEIKKMGFNHIWYTGIIEHATQTDYSSFNIKKDHPTIVKGKAGSPYAIKDYYDIDPDLADNVNERMNEFESLVERSHKAGLKVIIDFIPNHVAREYYSDAKPSGVVCLGEQDNIQISFDPRNNFYYLPEQEFTPSFSLEANGNRYKEFPAKVTGNDCFSPNPSINDWYETIKLNYGIDYLNNHQKCFSPIPATWKKMLDILLFWAGKNIDGFRCDMAEMVPVEFWHWAIEQVKTRHPNILFIAEVYNPNLYRDYLHIGNFDYLYDKIGLYDTLKEVVIHNRSAHNITHCWQAVDDIQSCMLNFLENHDEQRIASDFFAKDPIKYLPALVVSATMNTNPFMLYFGQELGEPGMDAEGFSGRDGRTTIFDYWSIPSIQDWINNQNFNEELLSKEQKILRKYYIKILTLCNKNRAISEGLFYDLMYVNTQNEKFNDQKQYAYLRYLNKELLLVVANFDNKEVDIEVFIPNHALTHFKIKKGIPTKDLLSGTKFAEELNGDSNYRIKIKSHDAVIIRFDCL